MDFPWYLLCALCVVVLVFVNSDVLMIVELLRDVVMICSVLNALNLIWLNVNIDCMIYSQITLFKWWIWSNASWWSDDDDCEWYLLQTAIWPNTNCLTTQFCCWCVDIWYDWDVRHAWNDGDIDTKRGQFEYDIMQHIVGIMLIDCDAFGKL